LVIVTTLLMGFTYQLWRATKKLASDTVASGNEQARLTREALELSRQEFVKTYRPRLRIRQVEMRVPKSGGASVDIEIANIGDSTATIRDVRAADWDVLEESLYSGEPVRPVVPQFPNWVPAKFAPAVLKSGETALVRYESDDGGVDLADRFEDLLTHGPYYTRRLLRSIALLLEISYADDLGIVRRTAGLRWLGDPASYRFIATKENDFTYED
jgi:hypothetical protein